MIAIDTLVHNFLHRTGILQRSVPNTPMARPATGQAGAPILLPWRPSRSTPMRSIRGSLLSSRGSCSTPSGATAPSRGSTFATAIASMIASLATICIAKFVVVVIV